MNAPAHRDRAPGPARALRRALACASLAAGLLAGCDVAAVPTGDRPERLEPGAPRAGEIVPGQQDEALFTVDVPADAIALRVALVARGAELCLDLGRGPEDDAALHACSESGRAWLRADRLSAPAIGRGRWRARVSWTGEALPQGPDGPIAEVPFTLTATIWRAEADGVLAVGARLAGEIAGGGPGSRTYRVDVPEEAPALRIDVADTDSDVDLFLRASAPFLVLDSSVLSAEHLYGRETIWVQGIEGRPLEPGPYFVDVVAPWNGERPARFELLATLARDPPAELLALPKLPETCPRAVPELARALCTVVEITVDDGIGSGAVIGADGWILTNAHVVERLGGGPCEEVVVSFPLDPARPAVESYRGVVARYDEALDLALVRVSRGFLGQPLPEGTRFPTLELGSAEAVRIGAPLWLVGYPATGGEGSRVPISATRGVLAGLERGPAGVQLKTDAEITQGNSGGAALDAEGRLVGVPTSTVENGSGQLGYVRPIEAVPEEWLALSRTVRVR